MLILLSACADPGGSSVILTDPTESPASTPIEFAPPACELPAESACGEPGSIVQGQVRVAADIGRKRGDLFLALTHSIYDGPAGGGFHTSLTVPDVDLSEPVPFAIDMCTGGAMWSEENCEYSLVVILDTNGDQGFGNLLPGDNEPATRVGALSLSCDASPPCLDVVLDCKGPDCVQFSDEPVCGCDAASCASIVALCE